MWGKWVLAAVPIALVVGCGGSSGPGSVQGDEGVIHSEHASAPTPAVTQDVKQQLLAWGQAGGLAQIQAISGALGAVHDAGVSADPTSAQGACEKLTVAVTAAKAYPPIPDPPIQAHWAAALFDFNQSALDCATGIANLDTATIQKSATAVE